MAPLLRITGPDPAREIALDPSGAELTVGRDASADIQLHDPEKSISRKHLALRQADGGVELRVISSVNGVDTSRGAVDPGQRMTLAPGDYLMLSGYRIEIALGVAAPAPMRAPMAASPVASDDPFAALLGGFGASPRQDDPFQNPEYRAAPAARAEVADPFAELRGSARPATSGPFGDLLGSAAPSSPGADGGLGGFGQADRVPAGAGLDDWLGGGSSNLAPTEHRGGPLDAFLGRAPVEAPRALSPDHVQGFNMPMHLNAPARSAPVPPMPAPMRAASAAAAPPVMPPPPADDVWSNLLEDWGGPPPSPPPIAAAPPPVAALPIAPMVPMSPAFSARPSSLPSAPAAAGSPFESSLDISFDDEAFGSWTGEVPAWSSEAVNTGLPQANVAPSAAPPPTAVGSSADYLEPTLIGGRESGAGEWAAFAKGLGLADTQGSDAQAAERAGTMVRLLVEGLADLLAARADLKRELRAEDRTMLSGRDNNPLKLKLSAAELVQYLFAANAGSGAYMPAERAVRESIAELRVHEHATIAAARSAVEGALRDFEPGKIRKRLVKGKPGLFQMMDHAKLWDAYQADYEKQAQHMADWLETIFDRHFMPTYSRETERLKQMAGTGPAG